MSEEKKNRVQKAVDNGEHPEWATCLMGKLMFCPKCGKETMLSDGIKEICTNCDYQN